MALTANESKEKNYTILPTENNEFRSQVDGNNDFSMLDKDGYSGRIGIKLKFVYGFY
jgi:hypothetical protein